MGLARHLQSVEGSFPDQQTIRLFSWIRATDGPTQASKSRVRVFYPVSAGTSSPWASRESVFLAVDLTGGERGWKED